MNQLFTTNKALHPQSRCLAWPVNTLRNLLTSFLLLSAMFLLPQKTNAAIGDYINGIDKDRAAYSPGAVVNFSISFKQSISNKTLKITYYQYNNVIATESKTISGTSATWQWTTPNSDYKGYLVKAELKDGGTVLDYSTIAVDVSSNWAKFPRYGFLSNFGDLSNGRMDSVINNLNRHHINGLQFYDWMDTHHDPLGGTASKPYIQWNDIANRPTYFNTIKNYINKAHDKGMKAMFYNLIYGAYPCVGISDSLGLFTDNQHAFQWTHDLPCQWEKSLKMFNPGDTRWQNYINAAHNEVYNSELAFDGFHADQLGKWTPRYNFSGTEVYPDQSFDNFLNAAKSAQPNKALVMNAVNNYGQQYISQSAVEFTYTEVWPPENTQYKNFGDIIWANNDFKNTNTVLAAYIHKEGANNPGQFKPASVLTADATIFAFGGAHLELGEHMLCKEWFPNNNLSMSAELKKDVQSFYDFSVAYENILRDGRTFNNVSLSGPSGDTSSVRYWPPVKGKIATVGVQWGNNQVFHLLNFTDALTLDWQDNNKIQPEPDSLINRQFSFPYTTPITRMWAATPDTVGGQPVAINDFVQVNGVVTFRVPFIKYWTMVVAETGAAMETCATPALNIAAGTYTAPLVISLSSATSGAVIRYTTDGSTPTSMSPIYSGPFSVAAGCTIKAYASKAGMIDSEIASQAYTINLPSGITSGTTYKVLARHSGKALDVAGQSTSDGTIVYQYDYLGAPNQKWTINATGNGYWKFVANHSNKAMDVVGGSTSDGAGIHQWGSLSTNSQDWSIINVASGYFKIENRNSGKCLDVYGAGTADETPVKQYSYTGGTHQQFSFTSVPQGFMSASDANSLELISSDPTESSSNKTIYPNPADASIHVKVKGRPEDKAEVKIYTLDSKLMLSKTTKAGTTVELNTSALIPGVYLVKIKIGESTDVEKLIINR